MPLIGIPMLGDQWYNVEKYVIHKIGMKLALETLTEDILKNAIENVIGNTRYDMFYYKNHVSLLSIN